MTLIRRIVFGVAAMTAFTLGTADPASAHGGGSFTSNYRTTLSAVSPDDPALDVSIIDIDGTIELTWSGAGELIVVGYEGEPYLRIGAAGVERNARSPATYLNQDRYARVALPASADADAPPEWHRLSAGRSVSWHDHRTHWMDRVPPEQVRADPDRTTVIFSAWEIPLVVGETTGSITGRLAWVPAPSSTPIFLVTGAFAAVCAVLLATRRWQTVALVMTFATTAVFSADSIAYAAASGGAATSLVWLLGWPAVTIALGIWLAVIRDKPSTAPPLALAINGVIVAIVGGWDRHDVFTHSQIFYPGPDWSARVATAVCLAGGALVVGGFLGRLVPLALGSPQRR